MTQIRVMMLIVKCHHANCSLSTGIRKESEDGRSVVDFPTAVSQELQAFNAEGKKSNLNSALSSSHLVPKSFSSALTLNPDLRAELDQKIHVFKQCHKYKKAIST